MNPRLIVPLTLFIGFSSLLLCSCGLLGTAASVGLVKLQFGCLPEGTLIDTPDGSVPVERLATGDTITGYNGGSVIVRQVHQYQEDPAASRHLTVRFEGGSEVPLSPRHRICGVPAGGLKPGDTVGEHLVETVSPLSGVARSFDLLTDDSGYRIQGIPVNSMIAEMTGR